MPVGRPKWAFPHPPTHVPVLPTSAGSNLIPRPGACISSAPSSPSRSAYLADPTTFQTASFSAAGAAEGASPQPKVGRWLCDCGSMGS